MKQSAACNRGAGQSLSRGDRAAEPHIPSICWLYSNYVSVKTAARDYCGSLRSTGVRLVDRVDDADIVVLQVDGMDIDSYFRTYPQLRNRYVIGYLVWETDRLPTEIAAGLHRLDEIWTASTYCHACFRQYHENVFVLPHVVSPSRSARPEAVTTLERHLKYRSGAFYFYSILVKDEPRKNVEAAIQAFADIRQSDDVFFIVKTATIPLPERLAAVPGILPVHGYADREVVAALHRLGNCFVSSHCSEGWGMSIAEAMAFGRPVIATDHGGNTDYMNSENSMLAPCTVEDIRRDALQAQPQRWQSGMRWAYVDVEALGGLMRRCFERPGQMRQLAERARDDMQRYRSANIGAIMEQRLVAIGETLRSEAGAI